jgi:alkylation response protein AidB-like acyl-CoA dehydrogenase
VDLELSDDRSFFQETTRKFLENESPLTTVRALYEDPAGFDRAWWRRGAELGWTGMLVTEEQGGGSLSGEGLVDLVIVAEEFGRLVTPGPLLPTNVVADTISRSGSAQQQADVIPGIVSGDIVATWALSEGGAWDAASVAMTATPAGDGWTLSGVKTRVEAAVQADQFLVTARAPQGLTQFLVPAGTAGLTVTPQSSIDMVRRFGELTFDGVSVPASAVVGTVGGADADVERQLQVALVLQVAELCGITGRVFEFTVEWAFDRHSFGRPLASYQALKHRFADMKMHLEASMASADACARAVQTGDPEAGKLVSVAKAYVGDNLCEVLQDCVQMFGGIGVTWEHDIHLYLRRATLDRALYGSPDDHRERVAVAVGA